MGTDNCTPGDGAEKAAVNRVLRSQSAQKYSFNAICNCRGVFSRSLLLVK